MLTNLVYMMRDSLNKIGSWIDVRAVLLHFHAKQLPISGGMIYCAYRHERLCAADMITKPNCCPEKVHYKVIEKSSNSTPTRGQF